MMLNLSQKHSAAVAEWRDMDSQFLTYANPVIVLMLLILGVMSNYLQQIGRPNFAGLLLAIAILFFLALAGMNWFVRYVQ